MLCRINRRVDEPKILGVFSLRGMLSLSLMKLGVLTVVSRMTIDALRDICVGKTPVAPPKAWENVLQLQHRVSFLRHRSPNVRSRPTYAVTLCADTRPYGWRFANRADQRPTFARPNRPSNRTASYGAIPPANVAPRLDFSSMLVLPMAKFGTIPAEYDGWNGV